MFKICEVCSTQHDSKFFKKRFCSTECYHIYRSIKMLGPGNLNWKGGDPDVVCVMCGGKRKERRTKIFPGRAKFCSQKCYGEWESIHKVREKSAQWKGGTANHILNIRGFSSYEKWRMEVFKRDNFKCQRCGRKGIYLNAHHIKYISEIVSEMIHAFPLLNPQHIARDYGPLWDISNGITLCTICHKLEHRMDKEND